MELILLHGQSQTGMKAEEWRDVPGFGDNYQASSMGRIRSKPRIVRKRHANGKVMWQRYSMRVLNCPLSNGYAVAHISVGGRKQNVRAHHMVLLAFKGPRPNGMIGLHNDSDRTNNTPENLRWGTHDDNMQDRKRHGNYAVGEAHHNASISETMARNIAGDPRVASRISEDTGVSVGVIQRIKKGETWKHLDNVIPSPGLSGRRNPKGSCHGMAKLSENDVRHIRESKKTQDALAAQFGVTQTTISDIQRRKSWRHI